MGGFEETDQWLFRFLYIFVGHECSEGLMHGSAEIGTLFRCLNLHEILDDL